VTHTFIHLNDDSRRLLPRPLGEGWGEGPSDFLHNGQTTASGVIASVSEAIPVCTACHPTRLPRRFAPRNDGSGNTQARSPAIHLPGNMPPRA